MCAAQFVTRQCSNEFAIRKSALKMHILSPGGLQIRPNDHSAFFANHVAIGTIQQIYKRGFFLCAAQFVARQCSNEFAIRKSAL